MYNEEIKTRFISEFSTGTERQKAAEKMFEALEKYEIQWSADICTIEEERLAPVVDQVVGGRKGSASRLYIMRDYIQWCIDNGVEGARTDFFNLKDIGLQKMSRRFVSDPKHLQRYLDYVCYPLDQETNGCIFRCYFWLAFSGINEKDAFNIRASDVDMENLVIYSKGMEFPLYKEAVPAFEQCMNLKRFKVIQAYRSCHWYIDRMDGENLLRGSSGTPTIQAMKVESSKKAKNPYAVAVAGKKRDEGLELELCYPRVWLSGVFYRTYILEGMGIKPNFTGLAKRQQEGKVYKVDKSKESINVQIRKAASNYLSDYNNWKKIFSL